MERLLVGDTADAVARRSRVPCLSLPAGAGPPRRIHVALDGSHRGHAVLRTVRDFAVWADARLTAVTVEPFLPDESLELALSVPSARTLSLQQELSTFTPDHPGLDVRRGLVVESLLESLADARADTLALGVHRGGPPGVAEAGSVARRMLHAAPCAVLTIPL